jgi:hypothetical protein
LKVISELHREREESRKNQIAKQTIAPPDMSARSNNKNCKHEYSMTKKKNAV